MHAFMSLQHRDSSFVSSGDPPKSSGTDWSGVRGCLRHSQATPPRLTRVTVLSTGSPGSSRDRLFQDTFANFQLQSLLDEF